MRATCTRASNDRPVLPVNRSKLSTRSSLSDEVIVLIPSFVMTMGVERSDTSRVCRHLNARADQIGRAHV